PVILAPPLKEATPPHAGDRTARIAVDERVPFKEFHHTVRRPGRRTGSTYKLRNGHRRRKVHQRADNPGRRRSVQRSTWSARPSPWIPIGTPVMQEQRRTFKEHTHVSCRVNVRHATLKQRREIPRHH